MTLLDPRPAPKLPPGPPVLITGGGTGIGRACALALAREGYPVVAGVKSLEEQGTIREDARSADLPLDVLPFDITSEEATREAFKYLDLRYGSLRALVNNAGIGAGGFFEDVEEDELRAIFEVNVFGTARVTRAAIPLLRAAGKSHLVTISSLAGRLGVPAMGAYHSSKFALEGLFECLYHELRPFGIRVALVEPGLIRTPILSAMRLARKFNDPASIYYQRAQKGWADFQQRFERTAQPPEIVAAAISGILRADDPPLRHPVGLDARIILAIRKLLPARLWMSLWRRFQA